jgi:hypothetical protein
MTFARLGSVFLAAATASMAALSGVHAQEASAEITATATVTPPPIEISESDLNFGSLLPGETVNIESNDFRGWGAEDHWPGRLEIENFYGGGSFTVTFSSDRELDNGIELTNTNGEETLAVIWDSNGHAGAYIERTSGQTGGQTNPTGYYSWTPVPGRPSDPLFATPSTGQSGQTNITVHATIYIGGKVAWTGDEPPGVYTGSITARIDFTGQ